MKLNELISGTARATRTDAGLPEPAAAADLRAVVAGRQPPAERPSDDATMAEYDAFIRGEALPPVREASTLAFAMKHAPPMWINPTTGAFEVNPSPGGLTPPPRTPYMPPEGYYEALALSQKLPSR